MKVALTLVLSLALFSGCKKDAPAAGGAGGGGMAGGFATADAAVKAFFDAVSNQDAKALEAAFATDAVLEAAVSCTVAGEGPAATSRKSREDSLKKMPDAKGVKFEFVSSENVSDVTFEEGKTLGSCTFKQALGTATLKVKFKITMGDKTEEESEVLEVGSLGGKFFILDMK